MRQLLAPLTPLYGIGVALDRALARPQRLPVPVISVGNITWGRQLFWARRRRRRPGI